MKGMKGGQKEGEKEEGMKEEKKSRPIVCIEF